MNDLDWVVKHSPPLDPNKRKPGLLVRMEPELLAAFHAACDEDGRSAAETVRRFIKRYVEGVR